MADVSAEARFTEYYAATPQPPWDIGRPQAAFVTAADRIGRRVLESGCGTGDLAIWLASRGRTVTGVDFLLQPIERAREKAAAAGVQATFLQMDALAVGEIPRAVRRRHRLRPVSLARRRRAGGVCGGSAETARTGRPGLHSLFLDSRAGRARPAADERGRHPVRLCRRLGDRIDRAGQVRGGTRNSGRRVLSRRCPGLVHRGEAGVSQPLARHRIRQRGGGAARSGRRCPRHRRRSWCPVPARSSRSRPSWPARMKRN